MPQRHSLTSRDVRVATATVVLAGLLLGACTDGATTDPEAVDGISVGRSDGDGTAVLAAAPTLTPFDDCDALLEHLKDEALQRVTPYGLDGLSGGVWRGGFDEVAREQEFAEDAAASAESADGGDAAAGTSTTNVQVEGVDEPDVVKTDGTRIVMLRSGAITVVETSGDEPAVVARKRLSRDTSGELLLDGDRLFVVGARFNQVARPGPFEDAAFAPMTPNSAIVNVTSYDLSGDEITEVASMEVDGTLVSARLAEGRLHLVTAAQPGGLDLVVPRDGGLRGEAEAEAANREAVEQSTIDDWLPFARSTDADGRTTAGRAIACEDVARPPTFGGFGTLSVVSVDSTGDDLSVTDTAGVLGQGSQVYATADELFVATTEWVDFATLDTGAIEQLAEESSTAIHAFAVGDGRPEHVASGAVRGWTLNQFAFDAHDGHLRVASTTGNDWWDGDSESRVSVLRRDGDTLDVVGAVTGLGETERIQSVRFMGDRGYVVTFRQTDPLYTIDLSDPEAPVATGELKIPGFSAYLHPVYDDRLLGIGQDADTETGQQLGSQVSLFDVSDDAAPERIATLGLGQGQSAVEWDHKAFLWWPERSTAVMPLFTWDEETGEETVGATVLTVTEDTVTEQGRVDHADEVNPWGGWIERAMVVDGRLWTLGEQDLRAHDWETLETTATVELG